MSRTARPTSLPGHPRRIDSALRRSIAIEHRLKGWAWDRIAAIPHPTAKNANGTLYADRKGAYRAVMAELKARVSEPAAELLAIETARSLRMTEEAFAVLDDPKVGAITKAKAMEVEIRNQGQRARWHGLDVPYAERALAIMEAQAKVEASDTEQLLAVLLAVFRRAGIDPDEGVAIAAEELARLQLGTGGRDEAPDEPDDDTDTVDAELVEDE